ncbi:MAG: hypothetical protein QXV22_04835 [Thermoplasmataceae archaeon]
MKMVERERSGQLKLLKYALTELVDSFVNSQRARDCDADLNAIRSKREDKIKKADDLKNSLIRQIEEFHQNEKIESFNMYRETMISFISSTMDDFKKKITPEVTQEERNKQEELDSYRAKSVRGIESFLSRDLLPVIDSEVSLRYVNGGYEAKYRCTSQQTLEYEFLLNTGEVEFLKNRLEMGALMRGIKLPVRLGKSWMSKDVVVDFEKLDDFYLSSASLSNADLFVKLRRDDTDSEIKIHHTATEANTFMDIDYKDPVQAISITSEPALNSKLDRETINAVLKQIKTTLVFLKGHKLRILRVSLRDNDVLKDMSIGDLIIAIFDILSPSMKDEMYAILNAASGIEQVNDGNIITKDFVLERLKLLGDISIPILSMLDATGLADYMKV